MKKTFAWMAVLSASAALAQSIAIVDMEAILAVHPNTPGDKKQLELTLSDYSKERDTLRANLEKMDAEVGKLAKDSQNPMYAPEKQRQLREDAMKLNDQLQAATRDAEMQMEKRKRDLQELEARLLKRTGEEIIAVVNAYAKDKKIDLVLYKQAVAFRVDSMDITEPVIALIKAGAVAPEAKATETPAEKPAEKPAEAPAKVEATPAPIKTIMGPGPVLPKPATTKAKGTL